MSLDEDLRLHISLYPGGPVQLALDASWSYTSLYRYLKGQRSLTFGTAAKLVDHLQLELVPRALPADRKPKKKTKKKGKGKRSTAKQRVDHANGLVAEIKTASSAELPAELHPELAAEIAAVQAMGYGPVAELPAELPAEIKETVYPPVDLSSDMLADALRKVIADQVTDSEFSGPLLCPVCQRLAGPDDWEIQPEFGYRVCPACVEEGQHIVPVQAPAGLEGDIHRGIPESVLQELRAGAELPIPAAIESEQSPAKKAKARKRKKTDAS